MRRFDSFSIISCIISPWPPQVCNPTMAATMATAERLGWNAMLVSSQTDRMAAETAEVSKICRYAPRSEQSVKMEPDSDPFQRDVPLPAGVEDTTKSGPWAQHECQEISTCATVENTSSIIKHLCHEIMHFCLFDSALVGFTCAGRKSCPSPAAHFKNIQERCFHKE